MIIHRIVPILERPPVASAPAIARKFTRPPTLGMLPRRVQTSGVLASTGVHIVMLAALIWLPRLFPSPTFIPIDPVKPAAASDFEPLVLPGLPHLEDRGSGSRASTGGGRGSGSGPVYTPSDPPPQKPDYVAPQEIVSVFPNAVNRVQTIRRPDLMAPPQMKFPMRLQSMVVLPSPTPISNTSRPKLAPPPASHEEVPVDEATVRDPALTLTPKRLLPVPAETAPPQTTSLTPMAVTDLPQPAPSKAVVVINAVAVPPDPAAAIPNAELAGNFVVGPAPDAGATEKSRAAGTGHSSEGGPSKTGEGSSGPGLESGRGTGAGSGHATGTGSGNRADVGTGAGSGPAGGSGTSSGPGSGNGTSPGTGGKSGAGGGGTGPGSTRGPGSGNGAPGTGSGNGAGTGISISGGVPGRNGAAMNRAVPLHRSYGMMIISGGSSGGASRDIGVFDRSETVYSVTISMADAGGGPDWPLQYALLNPAPAGAGLLVPPFVQKKVAATASKSQLVSDPGPVFISGVIDENGKLQSLRSVRAPDARSLAAIRALQQWQFLPAQLDGKPVASKVLIGVTVTPAE